MPITQHLRFRTNHLQTARTGGKLFLHRAPPACSFTAIPNHHNLKQIRYWVHTYSCRTTVTGRLRCDIRTLQGDIVKPFIAHKLLWYRGCCLVGLRAGIDASKKRTTFCPLPCRESERYQMYTWLGYLIISSSSLVEKDPRHFPIQKQN